MAQGSDTSAPSAQSKLDQVDAELRRVESQIEHLLHRQSSLQEERERLQRLVAAEARAPSANWAEASFPWDAQVSDLLRSVFRLPSWRPMQREVINATLQGRDVLCLMPSGGGKSLCYQLPALAAPAGSLTLVVSPLLALIVDQVAHLTKMNIASAALTSLSPKEEVSGVLKSLDAAETTPRLLYVTPERIASSKRLMAKLEKLYKTGRLARIAVDECHCASQWGNDFRPDYRKLGILRQQFPETPILALTATATATVCNDTVRILLIDGAETFKNSVDRPNLFYEVKPKPASPAALADDMATWIKRNYPAGDSGIVYCLTRKDTETLAEELRQRGIACAAYHADMDPQDRMAVHHAWADSSLQAITATVSFGMGVSKPNVRFVIHHSMSKSVENYYQESGRAGRDGLPAHCRLYYRFSDYLRQAAVVSMETRWEPHLRHMMAYATAGGCRRGVICRHFAEAPAPCRGMCDWCRWAPRGGGVVSRDATQAAASVLKVLQTWPGAEKRATLVQLIDKWRASEKGGAAKGVDKDEAERILEAMVAAGLVKLDFGFTAYSTNVYLKKARELGGGGRVELGAIPPRGADAEEAVKPEEGRTAVGGVGMPREGEYGGEVILGSRGQEVPSRELSEKGGQGGKDGRREEEGRARKKMKGEGGASRSGRRAIEAAVVVDLVDSDDEDFIAVKRA